MSADLALFLTAFGAGIVSFISPCNLALLPQFISYLVSSAKNRRDALLMSLLYAIGFALMFAIIGVLFLAGVMGLENRRIFYFIAGGVTILLASYLFFNKRIQHWLKLRQTRVTLPVDETLERPVNGPSQLGNILLKEDLSGGIRKYTGFGGAFLLGLTTGSSWIACVTPVFATILAIGTVQNQYSTSMYLMLFYGLGIMGPFILIGLFIGEVNARLIVKLIKYGAIIERIFALVLIWVGIEMILSGVNIPGLISFI